MQFPYSRLQQRIRNSNFRLGLWLQLQTSKVLNWKTLSYLYDCISTPAYRPVATGQCPPKFLLFPPNFLVPRKICFKNIIKKIVPPKNEFCPSKSQNLATGLEAYRWGVAKWCVWWIVAHVQKNFRSPDLHTMEHGLRKDFSRGEIVDFSRWWANAFSRCELTVVKFSFTNLKLTDKHFSTEKLVGKYKISKSKGGLLSRSFVCWCFVAKLWYLIIAACSHQACC